MTGAMICVIVTTGGVWDWEQKSQKMEISVLWQRFLIKKKNYCANYYAKALKFTSNLPGDLYSPAKCVEDVESFALKIEKKSILNMVQT